jgi:hypothetical protein
MIDTSGKELEAEEKTQKDQAKFRHECGIKMDAKVVKKRSQRSKIGALDPGEQGSRQWTKSPVAYPSFRVNQT